MNVVGDVLDLRIILPCTADRRGNAALELRHGREGRCDSCAGGDRGRDCCPESNWPDGFAAKGGALAEGASSSAAQVATEGRHAQLASVVPFGYQCNSKTKGEDCRTRVNAE